MSLPVPLGVRICSIGTTAERWVTRWVDDISFRSVVPGGYASATITLRIPRGGGTIADPDLLEFSRLTELFSRIQIVDLRSMEMAWEGRIEDPARQVEPDTWQIGALGAMVAATDIQRPVWYVNAGLVDWSVPPESWPFGFPDFPFDGSGGGVELIDTGQTIRFTIPTYGQTFSAGNRVVAAKWSAPLGYDQFIARFTTTHIGTGPSAAQDQDFSVTINLFDAGFTGSSIIDITGFEAGSEQTKTNVIGTDFSITDAQIIELCVQRDTGSSAYTAPSSNINFFAQWRNLSVSAVRQDRFGTPLTTAASYPGDYVTVSQVVEDVLGRFLVAGWFNSIPNLPWPGSVRPQDAYIDTSDTTRILHLVYPDGATAQQILGDLIEKVQPNAYWALWESQWLAADPDNDFGTTQGYRFEWATWPNNAGYFVSARDGLETQPNGDDVFNFVFYRYRDSADADDWHVLTKGHAEDMAPELRTGGFTRAITVSKEDPTDATTAGNLRDAFLDGKKKVLNAGTITVRRPIYFYDAGANSGSGASRMLDPWLIKPGKLVRVTDLPPRQLERDLSQANTLPLDTLNGVIFKVVACEYNSADNSCRMELDQVARWALPTQIRGTSTGTKTISVK